MVHLLVLDSEESSFRRVGEAIGGGRLTLITAQDLNEAIRATAGKDVALILCNAGLKDVDGYTAVGELRDRHPAATALLMTSGFEVFDSQRAIEVGISGCVAKPFSAQGLKARIEAEIGSIENATPTRYQPTTTRERMATILPDGPRPEPVVVDPAVIGPALESAILAVLPEVVESVLRHNVVASAPFQRAVDASVRSLLDERLEGIVSKVVRERDRRIETDGDS